MEDDDVYGTTFVPSHDGAGYFQGSAQPVEVTNPTASMATFATASSWMRTESGELFRSELLDESGYGSEAALNSPSVPSTFSISESDSRSRDSTSPNRTRLRTRGSRRSHQQHAVMQSASVDESASGAQRSPDSELFSPSLDTSQHLSFEASFGASAANAEEEQKVEEARSLARKTVAQGRKAMSDEARKAFDQMLKQEREHALQLLRNIDIFYEEYDLDVDEAATNEAGEENPAEASAALSPALIPDRRDRLQKSREARLQRAVTQAEAMGPEQYEHLMALAPSALSAGLLGAPLFKSTRRATAKASVLGAGLAPPSDSKRGKKRSRRKSKRSNQFSILGMLDGDYSSVRGSNGQEAGGTTDEGTSDDQADTCRSSKRSNTTRSTARTPHTSSAMAGSAHLPPQAAASARPRTAGAKSTPATAKAPVAEGSAVEAAPFSSRGERIISAILRKVFALEPEVVEGFFGGSATAEDGRPPLSFGFGHGEADSSLDYSYAPHPHHHRHHRHQIIHALAQIDEDGELQPDAADDRPLTSIQPAPTVSHEASSLARRRRASSVYSFGSVAVDDSIDSSSAKDHGPLEGLPPHLEPTTIEAINTLMGGMPFRVWKELAKHLGLSVNARDPLSNGDQERDEDRDRQPRDASAQAATIAKLARAGLPVKDERDVLPQAWKGQIHPAIAAMHSPDNE